MPRVKVLIPDEVMNTVLRLFRKYEGKIPIYHLIRMKELNELRQQLHEGAPPGTRISGLVHYDFLNCQIWADAVEVSPEERICTCEGWVHCAECGGNIMRSD